MAQAFSRRWGTPDPITGRVNPVQGLHEMMDFGAAAVVSGQNDGLRLEVMGSEKDEVHRYMKLKHPTVRYQVTYPRGM